MRPVARHFATCDTLWIHGSMCATLSTRTTVNTMRSSLSITLPPEVTNEYFTYIYSVCRFFIIAECAQITRSYEAIKSTDGESEPTFCNKRDKFEKKTIIKILLFFWMGFWWLRVTLLRNLWTKWARRGTYYRFRRVVPSEWDSESANCVKAVVKWARYECSAIRMAAGRVSSNRLNSFHSSQNIWSIRWNVDARVNRNCERNNLEYFHFSKYIILATSLYNCIVCLPRAGWSVLMFTESIDTFILTDLWPDKLSFALSITVVKFEAVNGECEEW